MVAERIMSLSWPVLETGVVVRKVLVALAVASAACGGGDETGGSTGREAASTGGQTGAAGTSATGAATGATGGCQDLTVSGQTFTVNIVDFEFVPDCFTASASQGIIVANQDEARHSFTLEGTPVDVDIRAAEVFNGDPVSGAVEPGTYKLFCRYHPGMVGEVTVIA